MTELPKTNHENENLLEGTDVELLELKTKVVNGNEINNSPEKTNFVSTQKTDYHNPEMDQFRSQQFSNGMEKYSDNEGEMSERDKEALITELKISLPSIKDSADELVQKSLMELSYIKNVKSELNDDIKDIAEEKLTKDIDFTNEVIKKYNGLQGIEKPEFFTFFCACKGYEKIEDKPKNGCLAIVDFSNTTDGFSKNKKKKTGNGTTKNGKLFLINMNTNEITLTTDQSPQGRGVTDKVKKGKTKTNEDLGFSNESGSLKSSLGFTQVKEPIISTKGSTGAHIVLEGLEPKFNSNVQDRHMYAHGGTYSEGCTVVPLEYRKDFLYTLIGKDPESPMGERGDSRGVVFTYSSNAVNYLKNSEMLV